MDEYFAIWNTLFVSHKWTVINWIKFNLSVASFYSIDSYDFSTLYITLPPYPHKLIKVGHHEILNQIKQLSTVTFTVLTIISLYLLLSVIDSMCYFFVKMNRQFFFIVHLLQLAIKRLNFTHNFSRSFDTLILIYRSVFVSFEHNIIQAVRL
jgi:hypothetical protein